MGFNISGLAINKNYENDFDNLQKELGWNLEKQSEIDFEIASSNWTEEGICDVYFSEKGTLIFINMDMCTEPWISKSDNILTFALSETSMAFNINYCENGIERRSIMEVNYEKIQDEGEKLSIEDKSEDTSEIIWNQIEVVIGKRFWDIEPDEKAIRYNFIKKNESQKKEKIVEQNSHKTLNDLYAEKLQVNIQKKNIIQPNKTKLKTIVPENNYVINTDFSKLLLHSEILENLYSDKDLIYHFDKIIDYSQKHKINFFLNFLSHGDEYRRYANFCFLVNEILKRPQLVKEISKRMPPDKLLLIGKFHSFNLDEETKTDMMNFISKINKSSFKEGKEYFKVKKTEIVTKKWWQFWK